MRSRHALSAVLLAMFVAARATPAAPGASTAWPTTTPAAHVANSTGAPLMAVAVAGQRIVAVGDHGVVLLSDDGRTYRQAKSVPTSAMLTSVVFLDTRRGFAGGHDGVVLATGDGGETWSVVRSTPGEEKPVLAMHFETPTHGFAVGLYGWAIETSDAGHTWQEVHIGGDNGDDWHLFDITTSLSGTLVVAGEQGSVFLSADHGATWQASAIAGSGSLWRVLVLHDGALLVCGMRGHVYRSTDDGATWQAVESGTTQSLTGIAQLKEDTVIIVGMGGTVLTSTDSGRTFRLTQRPQGEPLTGAVAYGDGFAAVSAVGPVAR